MKLFGRKPRGKASAEVKNKTKKKANDASETPDSPDAKASHASLAEALRGQVADDGIARETVFYKTGGNVIIATLGTTVKVAFRVSKQNFADRFNWSEKVDADLAAIPDELSGYDMLDLYSKIEDEQTKHTFQKIFRAYSLELLQDLDEHYDTVRRFKTEVQVAGEPTELIRQSDILEYDAINFDPNVFQHTEDNILADLRLQGVKNTDVRLIMKDPGFIPTTGEEKLLFTVAQRKLTLEDASESAQLFVWSDVLAALQDLFLKNVLTFDHPEQTLSDDELQTLLTPEPEPEPVVEEPEPVEESATIAEPDADPVAEEAPSKPYRVLNYPETEEQAHDAPVTADMADIHTPSTPPATPPPVVEQPVAETPQYPAPGTPGGYSGAGMPPAAPGVPPGAAYPEPGYIPFNAPAGGYFTQMPPPLPANYFWSATPPAEPKEDYEVELPTLSRDSEGVADILGGFGLSEEDMSHNFIPDDYVPFDYPDDPEDDLSGDSVDDSDDDIEDFSDVQIEDFSDVAISLLDDSGISFEAAFESSDPVFYTSESDDYTLDDDEQERFLSLPDIDLEDIDHIPTDTSLNAEEMQDILLGRKSHDEEEDKSSVFDLSTPIYDAARFGTSDEPKETEDTTEKSTEQPVEPVDETDQDTPDESESTPSAFDLNEVMSKGRYRDKSAESSPLFERLAKERGVSLSEDT